MKNFFFLLALAFTFNYNFLCAQIPSFNWAKQFGSTGSEFANTVRVDACGNIYTTGSFTGTVDFDPGPGVFNLISYGKNDIFLSKLDASGNFVWARQFGGSENDIGQGLALDGGGNIYTTGYFQGTADFDPGPGIYTLVTTPSPTLGAVYLTKTDPMGNFIFAKQFGDTDGSYSLVTVDATGNIIMAGVFKGTGDFDPGAGTYTLSSFGNSRDVYVCKLTSNGAFTWAEQIGGTGSDVIGAIDIDNNGDFLLTAWFYATADFDPGAGTYTLSPSGVWDVAVCKLNASGAFVWAKAFTGPGTEGAHGIGTDGTNNIFLTGGFSNVMNFGPGTFTMVPSGFEDGFVCKLDAGGNFLWAQQFGGTGGVGTAFGTGLAVDSSGNFITAGSFNTTIDFDPGPGTSNLNSFGSSDIFIRKQDGSGNLLWVKQVGGISHDACRSICLDASGNFYTAGHFSVSINFDPGLSNYSLTSNGGYDIFINKFSLCNDVPVNACSGLSICSGGQTTLNAMAGGSLSWYAGPSTTTSIGSGSVFVTPTLSVGSYTYYAASSTCTNAGTRMPVMVNVNALPILTLSASHLTICAGRTVNINVTGAHSYTWNTGANTASLAVFPATTTIYNVVGTNTISGCVNSKSYTLTVSGCVGLDELKAEKTIIIYPNPSAGKFTVESSLPVTLTVYNSVGSIVMEPKLVNGRTSLNLYEPSGIYILSVSGKNMTEYFKIVISD